MHRRTVVMSVVAALVAATPFVRARVAQGRTLADYRAAVADELRIHNADIQFYLERAARDPHGASDRMTLASLYLQRARETGDYDDNIRAESYARASLGMRHAHNERAFALLASALLAQHRFPEAHAAAESLVAWEPWVPGHRAMLGEIAFEMGRYGEARALFDSLRHDTDKLDVSPRLARWAELNGQGDEARVLLRNTLTEALKMSHLPREQVAWFALRLGDVELRAGHLAEAERDYRQGLEIFPPDYRLQAAMAQLMLKRGEPKSAVRYGEQAIATVLEPGTLGVLADAYAAEGDTAKANEYAHVMEVAISGQSGPLHRQWELFLLDHGRDVELIAQRAAQELQSRRDVYGYDVMAWALLKQGRLGDARMAMDSALRLGTKDPLLVRHTAAIDSALARSVTAAIR